MVELEAAEQSINESARINWRHSYHNWLSSSVARQATRGSHLCLRDKHRLPVTAPKGTWPPTSRYSRVTAFRSPPSPLPGVPSLQQRSSTRPSQPEAPLSVLPLPDPGSLPGTSTSTSSSSLWPSVALCGPLWPYHAALGAPKALWSL
ncbi:hypothetical protein TgHK011_006012 [Trichoderma gracile]|nr:hypothetical protein TgHK011_006012 [Trichoderma gracile]